MLRAIAIGDEIGSVASAQSAIEDDIENRRFGYAGAVRHLLRTAIKNGDVEEMLSWINEEAPGIFDVDTKLAPMKFRAAQSVAFDAWFVALPREEMLRRLDMLVTFGASFGFDVADNPNTHFSVLALRGETQQAIEIALERVFTRPVSTNPHWREMLAQAQYEPIVADPRVKDAMQRWEEEEAALRGSVEAYFSDMHAASTSQPSGQNSADRLR